LLVPFVQTGTHSAEETTMATQRRESGTDRSENISSRPPERDDARRPSSHSGVPAMTDGPAGNAVYDPAEQTTREDMPRDAQPSGGEVHRGSLPPAGRRAGEAPRAGQTPKDQEERERSAGSGRPAG
jgi:hypothetical protein